MQRWPDVCIWFKKRSRRRMACRRDHPVHARWALRRSHSAYRKTMK